MVELILLFAFCALLGLASLGAMGWALWSSEEVGVELIFLLMVCLISAALFWGMAAWMALQSPLRQLWKPETNSAASEAQKASAQKQETVAAPEGIQKPGS
ncbi:MAG: hypothetical protein HY313_03955 [Acidobacteria bacterium]|nr:hypothetical protein [Acidobacteriota bacterium]